MPTATTKPFPFAAAQPGAVPGSVQRSVPDAETDVHQQRRQTQQQVMQVVRHLQNLANDDISQSAFLTEWTQVAAELLVAEGAAAWRMRDVQSNTPETVLLHSFGFDPSTSASDDSTSSVADNLEDLLRVVMEESRPVVVPPHSGNHQNETQQVFNPCAFPLALVPMPEAGCMLGVFLPDGCDASAQNGMLRLLIQLAQIAEGFLQRIQVSQLRDSNLALRALNDETLRLHQSHAAVGADQKRLCEDLVDHIAECLSIDRAAIVTCPTDCFHRTDTNHQSRSTGTSPIAPDDRLQLLAISHVQTIEHQNAATIQFRRRIQHGLDHHCSGITNPDQESEHPTPRQMMQLTTGETHLVACNLEPVNTPRSRTYLTDGQRVLVVEHHVALDSRQQEKLPALIAHAAHVVQQSTIGKPSLWSSLIGRRGMRIAAMISLLSVAALFVPIPMRRQVEGWLRPRTILTVAATTAGEIESVPIADQYENLNHAIELNTSVVDGSLLVQCKNADWELRHASNASQIEWTREEIRQMQLQLASANVGQSSDDDTAAANSLQRLKTRLNGLLTQQAILREHGNTLSIRADADGIFMSRGGNAIQPGRFLQPGDAIGFVIPKDTAWIIDTAAEYRDLPLLQSQGALAGTRVTVQTMDGRSVQTPRHESVVARWSTMSPIGLENTAGSRTHAGESVPTQHTVHHKVRMTYDVDTQTAARIAAACMPIPSQSDPSAIPTPGSHLLARFASTTASDPASGASAATDATSVKPGIPVRITLDLGNQPLGFVLFRDLYESVQRTIAFWVG